MNQVVRFETTKRKLDWMGEEQLRSKKKQDRSRRDNRLEGREAKYMGEEE
jgi:hypothetical protein